MMEGFWVCVDGEGEKKRKVFGSFWVPWGIDLEAQRSNGMSVTLRNEWKTVPKFKMLRIPRSVFKP